jgi:hypothetical protein
VKYHLVSICAASTVPTGGYCGRPAIHCGCLADIRRVHGRFRRPIEMAKAVPSASQRRQRCHDHLTRRERDGRLIRSAASFFLNGFNNPFLPSPRQDTRDLPAANQTLERMICAQGMPWSLLSVKPGGVARLRPHSGGQSVASH